MDDWTRYFEKLRHRALYLMERYRTDRCRDTAAALTYMSLFALVPLLTVLYTMASAIPAFQGMEQHIQELLFEHLVPETSAGIEEYVDDFSRQARNLTSFGIVFLLATAVLMLRNIEQAFNLIWRTQSNRGLIPSFLLYWAVLSLAPVTIGFGIGVSTYLASFAHRFESYDAVGIGALMLRLSPYLLQTLGFTLLYAAVPNCRVSLRHALVGGLLATVAFNTARGLFTKLVAGSSITFIYGAFAAVPLFLLWIFISWNIVLLAAIVVHSLSAYQNKEQARRPIILKGLELLETLWRRQGHGRTLRELEIFQRRELGIDAESWQYLRDVLIEHRVITQDTRGHYLLSRDLHDIKLWQLQEWLVDEGQFQASDSAGLAPWEQQVTQLLADTQHSKRDMLSLSIADVFKAEPQ